MSTYTTKNRYSTSYRFTVEMANGKPVGNDKTLVADLRATVKDLNKDTTCKSYVKLQGRGHRQGIQRYDMSLPLKYATHADVYVYDY